MSPQSDLHPIKVVARRTGLTPHVIRVWERRYKAVSPQRTDSNRRLYTEDDIEHLRLLRQATIAGHSIGQIAGYPTEKLRELLADDAVYASAPSGPLSRLLPPREAARRPVEYFIQESVAAIEKLDERSLERTLALADMELSQPVVMDEVIVPLMTKLGDWWQEGAARAAHEHMASAVVRTLLANMRMTHAPRQGAPDFVITTPHGQHHEIGAMLVALTAAAEGWRVTYLGPSLPASEIAAAVRLRQARVMGLSICFPPEDPIVVNELRQLRRLLEPGTTILAGGKSAPSYRAVLEEIGAETIIDLKPTRERLRALLENGSRHTVAGTAP
jgi:DNA-binding transcriptional MerR regulator/methylmalonyl-CoA mutase cobalamin-binding subunit